MNRIYAALAALSLLAAAPAFAKSHVKKPVVADKAEGKTEVKAEGDTKPADAKPAKTTKKKTTKKTEEKKDAAPEAAPAK